MRAFFAALLLLALSASPAFARTGDYVVLLHGIGRTKVTMLAMQRDFEKRGYTVFNVDYPSRKYDITNLVQKVDEQLAAYKPDPKRKMHFVGYSLGGLVARAYVKKHRPRNMGRVVVVGSPNHGSQVADFLCDRPSYKSYFGPAGQELTTQKDYDRIIGKVTYELGSIAGDRSVDPVSSCLLIDGSDDGRVSIESTKIDGMKDHIVLHVTHAFMMSNSNTIAQARYFIEHGRFDHPRKASR